ncbi:MAG: hypothetical protein JNL53_20100 [Cyclobacteriaceae bacterium]|nr:hypothetical protein [Cyclobacteriaceae bacterium]
MKLSYLIISLLTLLFSGCDNNTEYDKGPCKFAPPESNFPIIEQSCKECFFNLKFQGKQYSFPGNRISPAFGGNLSQMYNVFFSFYLVPPNSDEELNAGINVKTPLMKMEIITKLSNTPRPSLVSTAFGIYNYCNEFFQPVTDDVVKSYHRLTKAELIETYPVGNNEQLFFFYLTGEFETTFIINGEAQPVTAEYKVKSRFYEKL